jgi:hypothetical protein
LKNMKVKWEYYSQYMEKNQRFQTTNQYKYVYIYKNICTYFPNIFIRFYQPISKSISPGNL